MKLSNRDAKWCRQYAADSGLDEVEVTKCVQAFFDDIVSTVRKLPFNDISRIYTIAAFEEVAPDFYLPFIGRLGPSYSSYCKWRVECADEEERILRSTAYEKHRAQRVDEAVDMALSGQTIPKNFLRNPIPGGTYRKVWIIDKGGKRKAARQLFKKQ